ncbi:MAG: hypothetical protein GY801_10735 [bacterium]|nr:hypothetical protein [bacterium]
MMQSLRGVKTPSGKQGLLSREQIAQAIPIFTATRVNVSMIVHVDFGKVVKSSRSISLADAQWMRRWWTPSVSRCWRAAAYKSVFACLKGVTHVLCRFHHQHGVTRWLKDHCSSDSP